MNEQELLIIAEATALKEGMILLIEKTKRVPHDPTDIAFLATLEFFKRVMQKWEAISRSKRIFIDGNNDFLIDVRDLARGVCAN